MMQKLLSKNGYKKYANTLYKALKDDAFYTTMEMSIADQHQARHLMIEYLEFSMMESEKYGELYIPEDHEYGVSVWSKPISFALQSQKSKEKQKFLCTVLGDKSLDTYTNIVEFMSERAERVVGSEFWYLSIVGVLPEYQGKGLGPGLVNAVLTKTDEACIPTYLETFTPRNKSFYKRLGYQDVASFYEPTTKAEYSIMSRDVFIK
jgi:ribosomal protein S18 acetylase RimI-like enzyme